MKIQDIRGTKMNGDYTKITHCAGVLVSEDGTREVIGHDSVVYVPNDLLEEYKSIIDKVCQEIHGYSESID